MIARDKLKAFFLLFVCMAGACLYFWMQSRYPDLGSKAALGGAAPMAGLGFFPLYEIKPDFTIAEKLFYGTINWLETNRRGMTFAFILGAFFLSLLPLIEVKRLKGGIKNAFLGLVMGTPLGLCVNCSAPVARAMQASGMSLEASLALLVSSPTMNVVVLTMAFAMFPVSIVLLKIALVLLFVLVIIPLSCRYVFKTEVIRNDALMLATAKNAPKPVVVPPGWWGALRWSVVAYVRNFIKILVMTGPLMVLAGFLGTAIITFLPWGSLGGLNGDLSAGMVFVIMLGVSFIGALLPAPMAFDVAMSAAMLQAGLPMVYTGVLLFTLGAYSIYAFLIVWQAISLRVAGFLMIVTMALGLVMGVGAAMLDAYNIQSAAPQANAENDYDPIIPRSDGVIGYAEIAREIEKQKTEFVAYEAAKKPEDVTIGRKDFIIANQKHIDAKAGFTRVYGDDLGILQPYRVSYLTGIDIIPRITTSVATGDVHQDGWDDVLILGDHEVAPNLILYSNMAGGGFARQEIPAAADVVLVALADVSGDGWLDIVYATYEGENFVIVNDKGDFRAENRKPLNEKLSGTTNSMGFADVNEDGKLDVLLGNWSVGPNFLDYSGSKDVMLLSKPDGEFEEKILPGLSGETLASMIWDFNHDGHLDLYMGNDFVMSYISDLILLGDGKGGFGFMGEDMKKMFLGGQSTMSLHAGDINNDLREEYFIGHIAYIGHYIRRMSQIANRQISLSDFCAREGVPEAEMETCRAEMEFKLALARVGNNITDACAGLTDVEHKAMCEVHLAYHKYCSVMGSARMNPARKNTMESQSRYAQMCKRHREAWEENNSKKLPEDVRNQHLESANESSTNILLYDGADNGKYTDVAIERGVGFGGWTWNAKFADLDNDGWQDVYVTNGYSTTMSQSTKVFYRNKGDGYFEDATMPFGLEDYSNTSSYSYVDYDFDGDLDIIAVPLDGKVKIFRNDKGSASNAVQFELEDGRTGNKSAIGAKIIIRYQNEGREITQVRSILASGGYKSFDAPVAHFGLGDALSVRKIEVTWPDGRKDEIEGDFKAGGRYRISRNPL